jgi:putative ABC transport system permease protein
VGRLLGVDPGFDAGHVVTMQVQAVGPRFDDERATHRFFDEALDAVRAVPGVASAAFTSQLPLSGDLDKYGVHLEARPGPYSQADGSALRYAVTPDYFDAMRIPLLHGRLLEPADDSASTHVLVVNERFAQQAFGDSDPLGQRLRLGAADQPWATIVGIVGDVKHSSLDGGAEAAIYLPTVQSYFADRARWLVVRARGDAARLVPAIRAAVWAVDEQPVVRAATMASRLEEATAQRRMMLRILQLFGIAALLLAAIGVYGVQAGGVAERTNEIGVRSALGATRGTIITLVLREGLAITALGLGIGVLLAASASSAIASLLFGVSRFDLLTYLGVAVLLLTMAAIASTIPAWRAARVDPSTALRRE